MDEMSGDEMMALLAGAAVAVWGGYRWYLPTFTIRSPRSPPLGRAGLAVAPLVCLMVVWFVLRRWSSHDVRGAAQYLLLFMCVGAAVLTAVASVMAWWGVDWRHDALERGNPAAATFVVAGMLAATLAYSGGNIGEGPTIWTTIGPATMALAALAILGLIMQALTGACEALTVERDTATAWRLGGALIGAGLVLGRAVAGDWTSSSGTVHDFIVQGWPAAVIMLVAVPVQWVMKPSAQNPSPNRVIYGVVPGVLLLLLAVAWVLHLGWW